MYSLIGRLVQPREGGRIQIRGKIDGPQAAGTLPPPAADQILGSGGAHCVSAARTTGTYMLQYEKWRSRSIGFVLQFCVAVLCCIVLHTYGEDKKHTAMKIIIATQNGAVSGTTATILVASNFSRVLPVHFFVVQNCVAVVLLRSILCCRTFRLGSVLVLPFLLIFHHLGLVGEYTL